MSEIHYALHPFQVRGKLKLKRIVPEIVQDFVRSYEFRNQFLCYTLREADVLCRKIYQLVVFKWHDLALSVCILSLMVALNNGEAAIIGDSVSRPMIVLRKERDLAQTMTVGVDVHPLLAV